VPYHRAIARGPQASIDGNDWNADRSAAANVCRRSERHFFLQIGQPANDVTPPRSLERFDILEGMLGQPVNTQC
jgi:hypothetical protein